jgi:hypothetical protein
MKVDIFRISISIHINVFDFMSYTSYVLFSYGLPVCKKLQKKRIYFKKPIEILKNMIEAIINKI